MTDEAPTAGQTRHKTRGRKLAIAVIATAGCIALLMWSFVLPVLGIVYIVEKLG